MISRTSWIFTQKNLPVSSPGNYAILYITEETGMLVPDDYYCSAEKIVEFARKIQSTTVEQIGETFYNQGETNGGI